MSKMTTRRVTLLSAVVADGASDVINTELYNDLTFQTTAASISSGGTIKIEGSLDGTNYVTYKEYTVVGNGTWAFAIIDERLTYVRAVLSSRSDGTYTVKLVCGV